MMPRTVVDINMSLGGRFSLAYSWVFGGGFSTYLPLGSYAYTLLGMAVGVFVGGFWPRVQLGVIHLGNKSPTCCKDGQQES